MSSKQIVAQSKANTGLIVVTLAASALIPLTLLTDQLPSQAENQLPELGSPLPSSMPKCRLSGDAALVRARALEGLADASWERVPFAPEEAARAVLRAAESESCFASASDREGAQRTERKRTTYESELRQRWSRARLSFELARRGRKLERMNREVLTLLALSRDVDASGLPYRSWLEKERRKIEAQLKEKQDKEAKR